MRQNTLPILDIPYSAEGYRRIDLTGQGPTDYRKRLSNFFLEPGVLVGYGGYLERRNLYEGYARFGRAGAPLRNMHLGLDLWAPEGTGVLVPLEGTVHSWANHPGAGDYGPVIILEHQGRGGRFFSLYGHLHPESLEHLRPGKSFRPGALLGWLGSEAHNGGYLPHLHFQLIRDLQGYRGDYPGVSDAASLPFFRENCPDPAFFLRLP
ncbi:peptidoglycan DD-metalloendopeptidase family protein [Robiginitalea sp. SC105]|uniref:peptidoglycan DD-metalloendopeptidase family protein n=1 Tax=Robiginitalea sp. SC105 TaxID=2762332 RepID=UPI001639AC70|nr:peptidoglycan DD-metalloendopeptidase family protein [Robiginitalea sp. SC105]MBC2839988.1 peptidoglycan DD-metalloendopeptidase family protein [Robiginitalea sp. SC105]